MLDRLFRRQKPKCRVATDATWTTRLLEENIDSFEKQKIKDRKTVFSEFIIIEMLFLGQVLKVYTAAYQNIQKIDKEDWEVFQNSMYPPNSSSSLDIVKANSKWPLRRSCQLSVELEEDSYPPPTKNGSTSRWRRGQRFRRYRRRKLIFFRKLHISVFILNDLAGRITKL